MSAPNYPDWLKARLWPLTDTAYVLRGLNPYADRGYSRSLMPDSVSPYYSALLEAVALKELQSLEVMQFSEPCFRPKEVVEWAERRGLPIPAELRELLSTALNAPDDLHPKERDSLLKMVVGMAMRKYGYNPAAKKSETASQIAQDLEQVDLSLDPDTIRKMLRIASELIPPAPPIPQ